MSKSGIPVVSQVAQAVSTVVGSVGDIFSGKNVFESLGRIVSAPFTAAVDLSNDLTFNSLAHTPIVGDIFEGGSKLHENPYDDKAAIQAGKGVATTAALTAATLATGGAAGVFAAVPTSTITTLGGISLAASAASKRDLLGVATAGANLAGINASDYVPNSVLDFGKNIAPLFGPQPSIPQNTSVAPNVQSNAYNSPAQVYSQDNTFGYVLMGLAGVALIFALRKRK